MITNCEKDDCQRPGLIEGFCLSHCSNKKTKKRGVSNYCAYCQTLKTSEDFYLKRTDGTGSGRCIDCTKTYQMGRKARKRYRHGI